MIVKGKDNSVGLYACKNGGVGKLVEKIWRKRNSWRKYHRFVASA